MGGRNNEEGLQPQFRVVPGCIREGRGHAKFRCSDFDQGEKI